MKEPASGSRPAPGRTARPGAAPAAGLPLRPARLLTALLAAVLATLTAVAVAPAATPVAHGAARAAPAATDVTRIADALRKGPVYVAPAARSQLPAADARRLGDRIERAGKPVFVAVLPAGFPTRNLFRNLRTETGVTGVYGIRLGDAFDARADSSVLSGRAVTNLVDSVQGQDPRTQLTSFVDQAVRGAHGNAPSSWGDSSGGAVVPSATLIGLAALIVACGAAAYAVNRVSRRKRAAEQQAALEKLRVVVDEDITAYGEELDRLDFHPAEPGADDAMRTDYEHALDAYETAKSAMSAARRPQDVRGVTEALEDGRFSLARLAARRTGRPLPERRPPCFFDPRHGPSVTDARWAPAGGTEREVPVCAADATRLRDGTEPMTRTVETGQGRRPYWEAGPAYGPWAGGYFGGGLLPGLLVGTLLGNMMAAPSYGMFYGDMYGDFGGPGYDGQGGDYSGGDFDPGDFGGGFGGGDGGGGDFGGGF